jgi:hypothetical protein
MLCLNLRADCAEDLRRNRRLRHGARAQTGSQARVRPKAQARARARDAKRALTQRVRGRSRVRDAAWRVGKAPDRESGAASESEADMRRFASVQSPQRKTSGL